ncbi:unnamed protein product [Dovyalis caffra]|uniref:Uncharacterized protein n=1 Tax=Dovyalis caffra TaxID=77055 RepID=A0AAV1RHI4_9ROSI|nr:unnamed protein product [Dovyalis caffra]
MDDGPSRVLDSQLGPICEQIDGTHGLVDSRTQVYSELITRKKQQVRPRAAGTTHRRKKLKVKIISTKGAIVETDGYTSDGLMDSAISKRNKRIVHSVGTRATGLGHHLDSELDATLDVGVELGIHDRSRNDIVVDHIRTQIKVENKEWFGSL